MKRTRNFPDIVTRTSFFSGAGSKEESKAYPTDLTGFTVEELTALRTQAAAEFDEMYGDGSSLSTDSLVALGALTDTIEAISGQLETLASVQTDAAALAARRSEALGLRGEAPVDEENDETLPDDEDGETLAVETDSTDTDTTDSAFAQKTEIKMRTRGGQAARQAVAAAAMTAEKSDMKDVVFAVGEGLGVPKGSGADFTSLGSALDHRLKSFNLTQYKSAADAGRDVRELMSFASIKLPIDDDLIIRSADRSHVSDIINRAVTAEGKNALLASGGWFAPSEILYTNFLELESMDGILSTPEVGISRGGAQITPGVSFADIYSAVGFSYTEAEDIAGEYDTDSGGAVVGPKPVYRVDAPDFVDYRLGISGLIIEAGLLAYRGYPEFMADVLRKALIAHAHKLNAEFIAEVVQHSTSATMTASQVGSAAPLLGAIELQGEHMRATHRMPFNAPLECKLPHWIKGAIRHDLALRAGVDLISVTDARIIAWFTERNVAVEFLYDWQPIETTAVGSFVAWPTTVDFLLYPAGTWVKGRSEVLTIDTLYDSTLLANNDFTALFTEEGWLAAKIGPDSRVVTCSINSNGSTKLGVDIKNTGAV